MRISVFRKSHFNASHRIFNPNWDQEKNYEVFGKCANPYFHGHNYNLVVKVVGEINPDTGYVIDLKELNQIIDEYIIERFDHKNLNIEVEPFQTIIPSSENICIQIFNILREHLDPKYDLSVRLYESERNYVEFPASG